MEKKTLAMLAIGAVAAYALYRKSQGKTLLGLGDDYSDYQYRMWYNTVYLPWYYRQYCSRMGQQYDEANQRCQPYSGTLVSSQVVSQNVDPYGFQNCVYQGGRQTQAYYGGPRVCVPYGFDAQQSQRRSECAAGGGTWIYPSGSIEGQCQAAGTVATTPAAVSLRWVWDVAQGRYVPSCPYGYRADNYYNPSSCIQ